MKVIIILFYQYIISYFQVYLPAIAGHIPSEMLCAISAIMEFCYLVRHSIIDEDDLVQIDAAIADFHHHCVAFDLVHPNGYSLPRQHSLKHYTFLIQEFGAPNGLCSSITESKLSRSLGTAPVILKLLPRCS